MSFIEKIKKKFTNSSADTVSLSDINELFFSGDMRQYGTDLSEITYFTCLKTLSESIGKMPIYLMDQDKNRVQYHDAIRLFNARPNPYLTPVQFFTYLERCRNHYGNAYAYIGTDSQGRIVGLYLLNPQQVQIYVNDTDVFTSRGYYYSYMDNRSGKSYLFRPEEVVHVKSWITTDDGLAGKSVREILATNMAGAKASQAFLNNLYQHGLTANAVVKYVGDLNKDKQNMLLRRLEEQAKDNNRRMITLPMGFDIQTLDLKLTDSQFFELKQYNALQIAAAFGIKPNSLNDYSKSSYANSAAQNLSFYVDTLLYNISLYEQELNCKLLTQQELQRGLGFKFNVQVILRGDPSQQADILQKCVASGIYSPNEARRLLDMPPVDGGDVHVINGSMVDVKDVGIAYKQDSTTKGGEGE